MSSPLDAFEQPAWLLAGIPWLLFWLWFSAIQRRALSWGEAHINPRFRAPYTRHDRKTLGYHLGWLLGTGVLLILAAAGPRWPIAEVEGETEGGRVLLFVDASASMYAEDVAPDEEEEPRNRFALARELTNDLITRRPEYHFAVFTYSGTTTLQVPLSKDRAVLEETLRVMETHNFYSSSGSSLGDVLDTVLRYSEGADNDLQAVVLGDGEIPGEARYDDPLAAVAAAGIPIHAAAIGSLEGEQRVIYDFRDVVTRKEEKAVLQEYHTRRVDEHLRRLAEATGGTFRVAEAGRDSGLATAVGKARARIRAQRPGAWRDLTGEVLALFLACFLLEALYRSRRPPRPSPFDLDRLASPRRWLPAALALLLLSCDDDLTRAHRENERGIARDESGEHPLARVHYRRSRKTRINAQIPTYNQARSATLSGDLSTAHDLYQEALLLDPDLAEAYFNDGLTLYRWGEAERDPRRCQLERTRELWQAALSRFETALSLRTASDSLRESSQTNLEALETNLEVLEVWISDPPPECASSEDPAEGSGAGGAGSQSEAEEPPPESEEEEDENQPAENPNDPGGEEREDDEPGNEDRGPTGAPPPGVSGAGPPPAPPPDEGDRRDSPLAPGELEQIRGALQRIGSQAEAEGTYHRRTRAEQFPRESWEHPDAEIWW